MGFARLSGYLRGLVGEGLLPGFVAVVAWEGEVVYGEAFGLSDPERRRPMEEDALFRLYSMTKPWVSALALTFVEDGALSLLDPVERYLPAFSRLHVGREVGEEVVPEPLRAPVTVYDLLRHTAGFTYGVFFRSPVKRRYLEAGVDRFDLTREEFLERLSALPLRFQPGEAFEYGLATDVLGHLLEALSGKALAELLAERVFAPLGMRDSGFRAEDPARLAQPFPKDPETGRSIRLLPVEGPPPRYAGGMGGVGTAQDYLRFLEALRTGRGLLHPRLARLMTQDHLGPLAWEGMRRGPEYGPGPGYGFGLGVAVRLGEMGLAPGSPGDFYWWGFAGTFFFVDPALGLTALLLAQAPSLLSVVAPERALESQLGARLGLAFRTLVYGALD
ncbi:serine hydrolase domain-containing protein [Thermus thermamylovorans]|uniref:Class A beta-lactamase-related serine hydrolase n=1 Tax=Thermus thermamylovorans TaxID=2509362 RepID=A0A4Q9B7L7_9DEIN|nr:serine hydrolase domain-containing protein [Thermus thermamylovorans]TBH21821.1 class A beta-lactamase-related serine hydrolase [Thermus thermamylovorans]